MRPIAAGVFMAVVFAAAGQGASALVLEAESGALNPQRAEIVTDGSFRGGKGVALKAGLAANPEAVGQADVVLSIQAPAPGHYVLNTYAAVDDATAERMRKARSKSESLQAWIQAGDRRPTRRVIFVPWSRPESCHQRAGVFKLDGKRQEIRLWLPGGVRFDRVEIQPYHPPAVPKEAEAYVPGIVPPREHPRLWVDAGTLSEIRSRLSHPEHQWHWDKLRKLAERPFAQKAEGDGELHYNTGLEQAALAKAFVFLMQGDVRMGRGAADLMLGYLPRVEFGNLLDITREIGAAIYSAACVYDWCHSILKPAERTLLRGHMMRLAEEMECGWPPFRQGIVNGHGNEAQVCRDLLAMSIAIHDDDPVPYRYCAYKILEELVPMRRFEYQSPRHNQGISYGAYRFGWEMHAAWLMRRMAGREVFDASIKTVPKYWLYMRLPNGEMMRDGDGVPNGPYWAYARTALLCYAYNRDPVLKGEFVRQGGLRDGDPLLFLLLNDPQLKASPGFDSLPLTLDFGPVLGGMIARTGWHMGDASGDVIAEVKGGGYHFGNHQHADAGSFQIYYRGFQIAKLAQYKFYGTPYDMNFAKRSAAQSMLLVLDPGEKILNGLANDGGSRFIQRHPRTPREATTDPIFNYGKVVSCDHGPSATTPAYSYFCANLKGAYSEKISDYTRRFCFLNLGRPDIPAAVIISDDVIAARPDFKKFWQLTALNPPEKTANGVRLSNACGGVTGKLDVCMLWPPAGERSLEILSGAAANSVFGKEFTPPTPGAPEANGHRMMFAWRTPSARERFLAVLQACEGAPLTVSEEGNDTISIVRIADRIVVLPKGCGLLVEPFDFRVPDDQRYQVVCAGVKEGAWRLSAPGAADRDVPARPGKNTIAFEASSGAHRLVPADTPK